MKRPSIFWKLGPRRASFSHPPSCERSRSQGNRKTEETHGDLLEFRGWQGYLALMEDRSATTSTSSGFDLRSISIYIYISLSIYMSIYSFFWEWMAHKKQQQFLSTEPSELFPQKNTSLLMRVHEKDILDHLGSRVCHALEGWKAGETLRGGLCQFPWHLA